MPSRPASPSHPNRLCPRRRILAPLPVRRFSGHLAFGHRRRCKLAAALASLQGRRRGDSIRSRGELRKGPPNRARPAADCRRRSADRARRPGICAGQEHQSPHLMSNSSPTGKGIQRHASRIPHHQTGWPLLLGSPVVIDHRARPPSWWIKASRPITEPYHAATFGVREPGCLRPGPQPCHSDNIAKKIQSAFFGCPATDPAPRSPPGPPGAVPGGAEFAARAGRGPRARCLDVRGRAGQSPR